LVGLSLIAGNHYNGSPTLGAFAAAAIQNIDVYGNSAENYVGATCYPVDIGLLLSGRCGGGAGDAFTNALQVGGKCSAWGGEGVWGGDQGQVGRGVIVKAKNAGTSVARLGAFVSEGTGEAGGLVQLTTY
jgi:hypothetical protein